MRDLTVCTSKGHFMTQVAPHDLSKIREHPDQTIWLDVESPTEDDFEFLREEFQFHPLAMEDATRRHQRPKVDSYGSYYFVVFYAINVDDQTSRLMLTPLYMFIGHNYLVTVHPRPISQIGETLRRWRDPKSPLGLDMGGLIYALLDAIVDDYFPVIDHVADRIDDMEQQIFAEVKDDALQTIFSLKKDLLAVRRVVAPERDVLNIMLRREIPVFEADDVTYLQDVYDHIVRIIDSLDTYRELLSSALDSYLSVQSNKLNKVVKALTVTSIVLMSATLVAGVYGMNFVHMPELQWRFGYAWALALMALISIGVVIFFRRIKWL